MKRLLLLLLFALPLFAQFTISPAQGPVTGGTSVTIRGDLLPHAYEVYFDANKALSTTRVDERTLVAVAPPHIAGRSRVLLEVYGFKTDPGLTFEYTGNSAASFERFLLPVHTPPVPGAFGSEFRTDFDAINLALYYGMYVYGLRDLCCGGPYNPRVPVWIGPWNDLHSDGTLPELIPNGTPGRFVYVAREHAHGFSANLRAYDTSRSAENFGTEVPVVRASEFTVEPFALLGVPRDARFRKTLRIYAAEPTIVTVKGLGAPRTVTLTGGGDPFTPAYAQISDFPEGTGVTDVILEPTWAGMGVWAFITVTNNETQHITTILPR